MRGKAFVWGFWFAPFGLLRRPRGARSGEECGRDLALFYLGFVAVHFANASNVQSIL